MNNHETFIGVDYGELESRVMTWSSTPGPLRGQTHPDLLADYSSAYSIQDVEMTQRILEQERERSMRQRNLQKLANLGQRYGSTAGEMRASLGIRGCNICGYSPTFPFHDRKECLFFRTKRRFEKLGYISVRPDLAKIFRAAGVRVHKSRRRPLANKSATPKPLQSGYYAPVWAGLLFEQSRVGGLTALHRPKVRQLISDLRYALQHRAERKALCAEEVLRGTIYACPSQAILDRDTR